MQGNEFLNDFSILARLYYYFIMLQQWLIYALLILIPIVLSLWNIVSFIYFLKGKCEKKITKALEVIGIILGVFFTPFTMHSVAYVSWWEEIDYMSLYPPLAYEYSLTFLLLCSLGVVGYYVLRFVPLEKQSPLITVMSISSMYSLMIICIIFCIQIWNGPNNTIWWLALVLPINIIILFTKVILIVVKNKANSIEFKPSSDKYIAYLESYLKKASDYPKLALVLLLPYLAIVVVALILFGQKPDSLVAMWTDTAEWNLSTKVPPPRLDYNGHYLCTVAVCGSPRLVRPLWVGQRRGHKILVNRQLAIANAFEQVLEEKIPKLHRIIRGIYDRTGYPISKHITNKFGSDITYIVMKPLEFVFVVVLYLVDIKPENRIYSQYRK